MPSAPGTTSAALPDGVPPPRERLLTWPLAVFLAGVLGVMGYALQRALARPDAAQLILLLADGDLDADGRASALRRLLDQGRSSSSTAAQWAAGLAAVALEDRDGLAAMRAVLGGGDVPNTLPDKGEREFLGLGDPFLANLAAAWLAEAAGDREQALAAWRRLAMQCRFVPRPLAAELAAAGIARTDRH
jgi:hypothetical protein